MPMAQVSITDNGRSTSFVCHSYEDADDLVRGLIYVKTGRRKEIGEYLIQIGMSKGFVDGSGFAIRVQKLGETRIVSAEEPLWLQAFAEKNGRQWKSKLRAMWFNNQDVGIARALRNNTAFAQGLSKFKLPEE